jgi:hypothetical protein
VCVCLLVDADALLCLLLRPELGDLVSLRIASHLVCVCVCVCVCVFVCVSVCVCIGELVPLCIASHLILERKYYSVQE